MVGTTERVGPCTARYVLDIAAFEHDMRTGSSSFRSVYAESVLDESMVPRLATGTRSSEFDGEIVVLSLETGELHHLDANASLVWAGIDGERSVRRIIRDLSTMIDIPIGDIENDVRSVIEQLVGAGLLVEGQANER